MKILALDPGTRESAIIAYRDGVQSDARKLANDTILRELYCLAETSKPLLVIESMVSYGMTVGEEVFTTCVWIGRFVEAYKSRGCEVRMLTRHEVKMHLCRSARARDGDVREVLVNRWGGEEKAKGLKKTPGPLYGLSGDMWSALALAVTAHEAPERLKP